MNMPKIMGAFNNNHDVTTPTENLTWIHHHHHSTENRYMFSGLIYLCKTYRLNQTCLLQSNILSC